MTTPVGTTTIDPAIDQFTYVTSPTVLSISPSAGLVAGGTTVTITGVHLANTTEVDFGGVKGTNVTNNSDTEITAVAPQSAFGDGDIEDVTVTSALGTSQTTGATTYEKCPDHYERHAGHRAERGTTVTSTVVPSAGLLATDRRNGGELAATLPTLVTPSKFVPEMMTGVVPASEIPFGLTAVTVGAPS